MDRTLGSVIVFVVAVVFFGVAGHSVAWTGPTQSPPSGNISAPLNVGTTDQVKNAGLSVNSLIVYGNALISGVSKYLNFGSTPGSSGYGIRDNAGTMETKNANGSWSAIATSTSGIGGSGTATYIPKFSAATTLGNSSIVDDGTRVGVGIATPLYGKMHVEGDANNHGIYSKSNGQYGVYAITQNATNRAGLYAAGVDTMGWSTYAYVGYVGSSNGYGVYANATGYTGGMGVRGIGDSYGVHGTGGVGVYGLGNMTGSYGVYGTTGSLDTLNGQPVTAGVRGNGSGTGAYGVYCTGTTCGGTKVWTNSSDERLKTDIHPLSESDGLGAILQLKPVTYFWKDKNDKRNNGLQLGFIAQDVEKVMPELVITSSGEQEITLEDGSIEKINNPKAMSYSTLAVPLVKAVQQLKEENDSLREELQSLKARVEELEGSK